MCGLVGMMGDITAVDRKAMKDLLVVDVLRGKHSTGVAVVDRQGNTSVEKRAVNAVDFLDIKPCKGLVESSTASCIIGHNRYATKGSINNINAHPFDFSNVVGAHNGTLTNYYQLDGWNSFDVDSECLYSHINDNGIDDAYNKTTGAFALTWYDKEDGKLKFLRNSQRPLHYCFSKEMQTLYWASEPWMLMSILWRSGIDHLEIIECAEDTLYTFEVPKGVMLKGQKLGNPHVRKLIKKTALKKQSKASVTSITGGKDNYNRLAKYTNQVVEFYGDKLEFDNNGMQYMNCRLVDDYYATIRIYSSGDTALWEKIKTSVNNFSARTRLAKHHVGGSYLLVDYRSIKEVPVDLGYNCGTQDCDDGGDTEVLVEGYNGEMLTYTQFKEATRNKCAWCTGDADFNENTTFISPTDFICHHCIDDPEVAEYVGGLH